MSGSILGPNGQRMVELGGERAWLKRTTGDIVSSYQWIDLGDEEQGPEACLCLFPANRHMDTAAYVIPQRNAYAYATSKGNPTPAVIALAFKAAVHMGFHPDRTTVKRIVDIVTDGIADLVRMPSDQPGALNIKRVLHGIEASARVNGRKVNEELL